MKPRTKFIYFYWVFVLWVSLAGCSTSPIGGYYSAYGPTSTSALSDPNQAKLPPKQIALLVPLTGSMAGPGQAVRDGFIASSQQTNQASPPIRVYDTAQADILTLYAQAIRDGADCVVGPLEKDKVQRLIHSPTPVPTLVLNYVDGPASPNVYEFGLSPLDEATQAARYAYQQGHQSALVIAPGNSWGKGVAQAFQTEWKKLGGRITAQFNYQPNQDLSAYIRQLLQAKDATQEHRHDADMIFMVAFPPKARQINPLLKFYYANDLPVYSISLVYSGIPAPLLDQDLNGIHFDDMPWIFDPNAAKLSHFPRLYALGGDAFALIMHRDQWLDPLTFNLSGKTGVLLLKPNHQISRQLVWAEFQQGEAIPV